MKKVEFTRTVYENGFPKFKVGEQHDVTPETERWVRRGSATIVDVKPAKKKASAKELAAARKAVAETEEIVTKAKEALDKADAAGKAAAEQDLAVAETAAQSARDSLAALEAGE